MLLCPWNFQTRTLERVAISSYRESCWPRDWIHISCTGRWTFYHQATWEAQIQLTKHHKILKLNLKHFLYLNNYKIRYGNNTEEHKGLTTIIFLRYFIVIQSLSHVQLFVTPWNAACQDSHVLHYLLEFAQTHVQWVSDAIQSSYTWSSPSPPDFNLS